MSGMEAICSASAYPEIQVGNGLGTKDIIKKIDGKDHVIENTLDPKFYRIYELDP